MQRFFVIIATIFLLQLPRVGLCEIYSYKDEKGVIHFSNNPCADERYRLVPLRDSELKPQVSITPTANCPKQAEQLEGSKTEQINPILLPPVVSTTPSKSGAATDIPIERQRENPHPISDLDAMLKQRAQQLEQQARQVPAPSLTPQEQPKDSTWKIWLGLFALVAIWLFTRRWFWVIIFGFSGVASLFAMIASVIHFQILGALGFLVLMFICSATAAAIAER